jgi:threonine/homoserine efflux transporter RhtA
MKPSSGLHFKTYVLILLMVIFAPVGNIFLGKGMKRVGSAITWAPADVIAISVRVFSSPLIWLGIGSLITFFVAYMLVLSWADYSYVQPASSIAYAIVAFLGYFFLGETVTPLHWLGIAVICLGVFLVGNTSPRTTGRA